MNAVEAIQERYEKIYILADEDTHKLIKTMKEDIVYLLEIAQTKVDEIQLVQRMTASNIIDGIIAHYDLGAQDESTD
jgi:hypothetical protein